MRGRLFALRASACLAAGFAIAPSLRAQGVGPAVGPELLTTPLCSAPGTAYRTLRIAATGWSCPVDLREPAVFQERPSAPSVPAGASLLLPGTGQWMLGQRRWALYAVLEVAGWTGFWNRRRNGHQLRDDYRALAWNAARAHLGGLRVDGDFDYYEDMANVPASGLFDTDPGLSGVQPETDPATFNGQIWELARGLFFSSSQPEPLPGSSAYQQALAYYVERSYGDELRWDWEGRSAERADFRSLIERSDESLRAATTLLGAIGANHLLSAVDALISARLSAAGGGEVRSAILPTPIPGRWAVELWWSR